MSVRWGECEYRSHQKDRIFSVVLTHAFRKRKKTLYVNVWGSVKWTRNMHSTLWWIIETVVKKENKTESDILEARGT